MTAPRGRTYLVPIDVMADEFVTILETGDLVLEDAVTGDFEIVELDRLDEFERTNPPYNAHLVDCIRRTLLSTAHDTCAWWWTQQPERGWWYRSGKCPTCGHR